MTDRLTLGLADRWMWKCHPLLQKGVRVPIPAGSRLYDLLTVDLCLESNYVADRLQTILIDGRPVDDVENATLSPDADVSLSGALPGLVGATLRKSGYYAPLRECISFTGNSADAAGHHGWVRLKLFNVVLKEVGPGLLARGVIVDAADAVNLVDECIALDNGTAATVSLNGNRSDWSTVRAQCLEGQTVAFTVIPET